MIHRRHALGFLAAASLLPARGLAKVSDQRSEIRSDLARRFFDAGTVGTFVGYKVDDYLIIASDRDRSSQPQLPASTFKIANSLIALETGVVGDPDKDVFKWDGVTRSIEGWNRDLPCCLSSCDGTSPWLAGFEHGIGEDHEAAQNGDEGDLGRLALGEEPFVEGAQHRIVPAG